MVDMVMDVIISFIMGFTSGILLAHIVIFVSADKEEVVIEDKEDEGD